jgi:FkbM family methyltransferase
MNGTNSLHRWVKNMGINTVLDIGANEGQFAKKISNTLPTAQIVCFEPLKDPFEKLKKNFAGRDNFKFFNFALGNENGHKIIHRNEYSPSSSILPMKDAHKVAFPFTEKEFEEDIDLRKLDDVLTVSEVLKPLLVKIDVQGFELDVIWGGANLIKNAEVIILETSFVELYEKNPLFDDIYKLLLSFGFLYSGAFEQLNSPIDDKPLQQDSIFIKAK